jgi:Rod binding domain-containing protein
MSALSSFATSIDVLKPPVSAPTGAAGAGAGSEQSKRAAIKKSADDFEASFLSSALGSIFEGVTISAPFGGGEGEQAFKSFLHDAFAKQIVKSGGIGVSASVQHEMLKLQGLSPEPAR